MILLLFIGFAVFLINLPVVQTKVAQKISSHLSEELNSEIKLDYINIEFFNSVSIKNLFIRDLHSDTLIYAEEINVEIDVFNLFSNEYLIDKINIYNGNIELKKYLNEDHLNTKFLVDYFKSDNSDSGENTLQLNRIQLFNSTFVYNDQNSTHNTVGINFNDIVAKALTLDVQNMQFLEDSIYFDLSKIKFKEQSGFILQSMECTAKISPSGIDLKDLILTTPYTNITADLNFVTDSLDDFNNFNEKVNFLGNFEKSKVNTRDLAFFATDLMEMIPQEISLNGVLRGKVNNLKGRDLTLKLNDKSEFRGNIDLKGLPEIDETFIYLSIENFNSRASYLRDLPIAPFNSKATLTIPNNLDQLGDIDFKGKFTGFLSDFVAYGVFKTKLGSIETDLSLKGNEKNVRYIGNISTKGFNLGELVNFKEDVGSIAFNVKVNGSGFTQKDVKAKINGDVGFLEFRKHSFKNISLKGEIANQLFNGDLIIKDDYLDMDFIGSIDMRNELPELNFLSNINHVSIGRLVTHKNIDSNAVLSSTLNIDLIGSNIDNLTGSLLLLNTNYRDTSGSYTLEEVQFNAKKVSQGRTLEMTSDLMDGRIDGNFRFQELATSFRPFIEKYIPAIVGEKFQGVEIQEDFNFNIKFKKTELVSNILFPEYKIDSGSFITGYYNSGESQLVIDLQLTGAQLNTIELSPGYVTVQTQDDILYLNSHFDKLGIGTKFYAEDFNLITQTKYNESRVGITWDNESNSTRGNVNFNTEYTGLDNFLFVFNDSKVYVADSLWTIPDSSIIALDSSAIKFENFALGNKSEHIEIRGKISENPKDQLNFLVENFELGLFNLIIPEESIKLSGKITGSASIQDPYHGLIFTSNVGFKKFTVNDNLMGSGSLKSFWLNDMKVLNIDGEILKGSIPTLRVSGNYFPEQENNNLDMKISLQNTYLQLFQPYVDGVLSNLRGLVSGDVNIKGNFEKPELQGLLIVQKAGFTIDYLKTAYNFSGDIRIEPDWFGFKEDVTLYDSKHGNAKVTGQFTHDNYKDLNMDIFLVADRFNCLNTTVADNELYYGTAFVTGNIAISGPPTNLQIDVDVKTDRSQSPGKSSPIQYTTFNIPLNSQEEVSESKFIRFINNGAEEEINLNIHSADLSGIQMNFNLEVTPDAEVRLIFDERVGDVLKSKGNGNLKLEINTKGDFNIFGDYIVKEGDYLFTLQNIINKKFSLQRGGSISWNGDPYEGVIDMTAVYRLRARLSDVIITSDSNSNYSKRVPVEVNLNMQNTLLQPDISFDINLPESDENTKSLLRNILYLVDDESNENVMNKQAFSLLLFNRFTPPDQGLSGSGFGATSSSEMLSNQLSNMLSQISDEWDLGFAYRPGDQLSSDEVELFVSTEIFNDRVVINTNFEYGGNSTNVNSDRNTSQFVGEFSVEYKIKDDGKLRTKVFQKANNNNFLENNNPYTQGIGLSFRHEFHFLNLFRRIFKGKKKTEYKKDTKPTLDK